MNCWESFYIQIYYQRNRLLTAQLTGEYNPFYEQAYFPCKLQPIPWHSLDQIGTHARVRACTRMVKSIIFYTNNVNISDSRLDISYL
jgi:hypothetical protein